MDLKPPSQDEEEVRTNWQETTCGYVPLECSGDAAGWRTMPLVVEVTFVQLDTNFFPVSGKNSIHTKIP